jgi:hypothetical protein
MKTLTTILSNATLYMSFDCRVSALILLWTDDNEILVSPRQHCVFSTRCTTPSQNKSFEQQIFLWKSKAESVHEVFAYNMKVNDHAPPNRRYQTSKARSDRAHDESIRTQGTRKALDVLVFCSIETYFGSNWISVSHRLRIFFAQVKMKWQRAPKFQISHRRSTNSQYEPHIQKHGGSGQG